MFNEKNKDVWLVFLIFIAVVVATFFVLAIWLMPNGMFLPKGIDETLPPTNLQECKQQLWESCGLEYFENSSLNCYRIEGKPTQNYESCQNITQEEANCWKINVTSCYQNFS